MQQLAENLVILQPGDPYQDLYENYLKIYLSGSLGVSEIPWQQKFINGLQTFSGRGEKYGSQKFLVINPLAPVNGEPNLGNPEFVQKTQWELQMMSSADVIFCNFLKKSTSPGALYGYLLWAQSGKVICRCPEESMFFSQVKLVSDCFGVPLLGNTDSVIQVLDTMFKTNQKFSGSLNYGLE